MTETQPWPPNIKPGLPTTEVLGMELPIIADLGDGWFLVAHPNGAAIATEKFLSALWSESTETAVYEDGVEIEDEDCCPIPESVRAKAVEEFEELAWPLVRGQFYTEAKETTSVHTAIPDKAVERLRKLKGPMPQKIGVIGAVGGTSTTGTLILMSGTEWPATTASSARSAFPSLHKRLA